MSLVKNYHREMYMFELILLTLTVLVTWGGVRAELAHYLEGLDLAAE